METGLSLPTANPEQTLSPDSPGCPLPAEWAVSVAIWLERAEPREHVRQAWADPTCTPHEGPPHKKVWGPDGGLSYRSLPVGAQPRPTHLRKSIKGNLTKPESEPGQWEFSALLLSPATNPQGRGES